MSKQTSSLFRVDISTLGDPELFELVQDLAETIDVDQLSQPTTAEPGSFDKQVILAARYRRGVELYHADDRRRVDVDQSFKARDLC